MAILILSYSPCFWNRFENAPFCMYIDENIKEKEKKNTHPFRYKINVGTNPSIGRLSLIRSLLFGSIPNAI